jgi:hypothetical protein
MSGGEGVQVEARTLSGVHIGRSVAATSRSRRFGWCGALVGVEQSQDETRVVFRDPDGIRVTVTTAPTDLVTLTDGGASS